MAMLGAVAIAAGLWPPVIRRRRAQNKRRSACQSTEDLYLSTRLNDTQIQQLVLEFCHWRSLQGINTGLYYGDRRVKLFLLYLARGGYYHQCGRAEGLSLTASALYLKQVAEFFVQSAGQYVSFMNSIPNHAASFS